MATVELVTSGDVRERLHNMQDIPVPATLSDERIAKIIGGVSGDVLHQLGLTAAPAAGVFLDSLKEKVTELVTLKIRLEFFPLDPEAIEALDRRWRTLLEGVQAIEGAEAAAKAASSITPTRRHARFTDDNEKVAQW